MKVVSDSSPLHYLILIEALPVLPSLFGEVRIPVAVSEELRHSSAPSAVKSILADPPPWLVVENVTRGLNFDGSETLGRGEQEAIAFASTFGAEGLLLIDESRGRNVAAASGVPYMGTLGVLDRGSAEGRIDLPNAIQRLLRTNFYVNPRLLKKLLDTDGDR